MFSKLQRSDIDLLSVLKGSISLFQNAGNTDSVYDIEDGLRHSSAMKLAVVHVRLNPDVARLMDQRYIAPDPDIASLLQYPPDSLGYKYAAGLQAAGFDPNFYRSIVVEDDISYLLLRFRQTHDIWHLVTGFGTDVAGELSLKAFELAQTRRPMAAVLMSVGLLKALVSAPESLSDLFYLMSQAYQLGLKATPLLAQRWEEAWDKPLTQWQQELGVSP